MSKDYSKLKRPKPAMPGFVKKALQKRDLLKAYEKRPDYQQDGYLEWINEVKNQEIITQRLNQMLDELGQGNIFMQEEYKPPKKTVNKKKQD